MNDNTNRPFAGTDFDASIAGLSPREAALLLKRVARDEPPRSLGLADTARHQRDQVIVMICPQTRS